jgi:hypothetical protein
MTSKMGPQKDRFKNDLVRVADEPGTHRGSAESAADSVAGAGEADRPVLVYDSQRTSPPLVGKPEGHVIRKLTSPSAGCL